MAALANALADERERLDLAPLPEVMRSALGLEEMVHRLAAGVLGVDSAGPLRIVLAGGGPNAATAREGALKLLETSYVQASGWDLEQILHGPLAAVTPETVAIVLAPSGPSVDRAVGLVEALKRLGVDPLVITDDDAAGHFEEAHRLVIPVVPEVLSPVPLVAPLQLFSYFLAVGKGLNPDLIHRDDERYRAARAAYE
jgi:glucosamine--fructose-6-phosphate aminotransferase (isomerizing)